MDIEKK